MSKSMEIGIIIVPDELTKLEAKKLQTAILEKLAKHKIIDLESYHKNYPNHFHLTLFQLRIKENNLILLYQSLSAILQNTTNLSFKMNSGLLEIYQNYIFWSAQEAKNLTAITHLQRQVVDLAKDLRDLSQPFSHTVSPKRIFSKQEQADIKKFGTYGSLPHNFNPHITLVYNSNSNKIEGGVNQHLQEITSLPHHQFYGKAIAVGELGPTGNVINILKIIKFLELPTLLQEGIFKRDHVSKQSSSPSSSIYNPTLTSKL